jgi:hypothetical protein
VRFGDGFVGRVDPGHVLALGRLREEQTCCTEDDVVEAHGGDCRHEAARLCLLHDSCHRAGQRLHVMIGEPAHAGSVALALVVHQSHELGPPREEANEAAQQLLELSALVPARLAPRLGGDRGDLLREFLERVRDRRPPERLLATEVVREQTQVGAGALGDVARARAVEAPLGEDLERGREDALARRTCGHRSGPSSRHPCRASRAADCHCRILT